MNILLPTGDDIASEAVRSVARRGFHDTLPEVARNGFVMAQFLRLVEEVGEYRYASSLYSFGSIESELADIMIVLCQLAWAYGVEPVLLLRKPVEFGRGRQTWATRLEWLARHMRKNDLDNVRSAIRGIAIQCNEEAAYLKIDLQKAIGAKLKADEQRGRLHGEVI